jgi:hypothetical protein
MSSGTLSTTLMALLWSDMGASVDNYPQEATALRHTVVVCLPTNQSTVRFKSNSEIKQINNANSLESICSWQDHPGKNLFSREGGRTLHGLCGLWVAMEWGNYRITLMRIGHLYMSYLSEVRTIIIVPRTFATPTGRSFDWSVMPLHTIGRCSLRARAKIKSMSHTYKLYILLLGPGSITYSVVPLNVFALCNPFDAIYW